ncbi:ABC transporter substrate-binding protein [Rhodobacter sp. 24-YEA-8]|uniref:ABC transporter substrate-binding protein n=1 Tax=Rhodobacter sp. 24-YEA-8 TaxID=1884310 RepID=UPI001495614B|nr:ABC transporter substrate-binding protein [Rhodobacter sp. 24-YEA-8]
MRAAIALLPECVDPQQDIYGYGFGLGPGRQLIDTLTFASVASGGAPEPWLATAWTVDEAAQVFNFTLRDDVTFSNEEKLIAQAVASDARTVVITFDHPRADFLFRSWSGIPGIVAPQTLQKTAEQRCVDGIIGSGPFVQDGAVNFNSTVTFKRREGYNWAPKGLDHVETIEWTVIPEGTVRSGALRSGQVDLIFQASTKDVPSFNREGFTVHTDTVNALSVGFFANTTRGNLVDPAVRRAIQLGIDRQKVIDYAFDGIGVPARNLVASGSPIYNDLGDLLVQDQAKAREILDAAGWTLPEGAKIREKDGKSLEIELTFRENAYNLVTTEAVQQQLAQIGIQITLRPRTGADFANVVNSKAYELHRWSSEFWPPRMLSPRGNRGASSLVLPALVLAVPTAATTVQLLVASLRSTLDEPFIAMARAKGGSRRYVLYIHELRGSVFPVVTALGVTAGTLIGGTVVLETVFSRLGIGAVIMRAVSYQDTPSSWPSCCSPPASLF